VSDSRNVQTTPHFSGVEEMTTTDQIADLFQELLSCETAVIDPDDAPSLSRVLAEGLPPVFAAAPDLLKACRQLAKLGDWTGPTPAGFTEAWESAVSAIAKATAE
jgi:hypothetical protein